MKNTVKHFVLAAAVSAASIVSAGAYTVQVDIDPGNTVVGDNGVTPFSGSVMLGYFAAGTDFSQPFTSLDSLFFAVAQGNVGAGGFQLGINLPGSGTWANGQLDGNAAAADWTSSASQDAAWDSATGFGLKDMTLVFVNTVAKSDGFTGTPSSTLFDNVTSFLIVDSGNNFSNSVGSSLGTTFATISSADAVLKASSNSQIVPEPASALMLIGGLGVLALRRRRA